jgi:hypothetical protein
MQIAPPLARALTCLTIVHNDDPEENMYRAKVKSQEEFLARCRLKAAQLPEQMQEELKMMMQVGLRGLSRPLSSAHVISILCDILGKSINFV